MSLTTATINRLSTTEQIMKTSKNVISKVSNAILLPIFGIAIFLFIWSIAAQNIKTSLGAFPGPTAVVEQFSSLYDEHNNERAKADAFYERQEVRNAKKLAKNPDYVVKIRAYTGKETFLDQIFTSLGTVLSLSLIHI